MELKFTTIVVLHTHPLEFFNLKLSSELVVALKALTDKPVAVITNGALLSDPQVREELCHADMVLPSLDAYNQEISKKIDRPYGTIKFEEEFEGLKKFTHMYEGELWLEIMLVDGINDDEQLSLIHISEPTRH